jgi:CheY-like chemotaxis protein
MGELERGTLMARVLVVDDDADFRDVVQVILEAAGHDVRRAPDGRVALQVFDDWRPDIVLLDMFMPEMDGLETVVAMRKLSSDVKIIAMSGGWGRPDDHIEAVQVTDQGRALGANAALTKPFDRHVLRQTIDAMMETGTHPE